MNKFVRRPYLIDELMKPTSPIDDLSLHFQYYFKKKLVD